MPTNTLTNSEPRRARADFTIFAKDNPVVCCYSKINPARVGPGDVACLSLGIGDHTISIHFDTGEEMIAFCEKHNFPYADCRQGEG